MRKLFSLFFLCLLQLSSSIFAMNPVEVSFKPYEKKTFINKIKKTLYKEERIFLKTGETIDAKLAQTALAELEIHYNDKAFLHLIIQVQQEKEPSGRGETFLASFCEKIRDKIGHIDMLRTKLQGLFRALTYYVQDSATRKHIILFQYPFKEKNNV